MIGRILGGVLSGIVVLGMAALPARADGNLQNVQHIVIVMQENHSFDNYFGALPYVPGGPYHPARSIAFNDQGLSDGVFSPGCAPGDHRCVDGLTCRPTASGDLQCFDSNRDDDGSRVFAFHDPRRCVIPDLDHGWVATHREANFDNPNLALFDFLANGFVRQNDITEQLDNGVETPTDDQAMNFYNQSEIPFYYGLAQNFAISDRYFAPVLGPTFPNRSYGMAATSFGHLTTSDSIPPPGGYKPIHGTIFDLMDAHGVTWADYFQDAPQGGSFRSFPSPVDPHAVPDPHFLPLPVFLAQAAGSPAAPPLPQVSFVDPNFGLLGIAKENDEHPPTDIQRGQAYVSTVINAIRNGPHWQDTVILLTYDEHGGFFDHVRSPRAPQGGQRTPDGVFPGQCEDLSNPPASLQPGGGAECSTNFISPKSDNSVLDAETLCPALANNPTGPFPAQCAAFDQLGIRVPFVAISPFSKPRYVSHVVASHTSMLALIEKRFMTSGAAHGDGDADDVDPSRPHLTNRDLFASTLEDMFDFDHSPSLFTAVGSAAPPAVDCTPSGGAESTP
jgi:phospholipase C